jgi:hypothetical protein
MVRIDKDVPMPHCKYRPKYPYAKMKVGDSFTVAGEEHGKIYGSAAWWSMKNSCGKIKFTTQKQPDGSITVWRIK